MYHGMSMRQSKKLSKATIDAEYRAKATDSRQTWTFRSQLSSTWGYLRTPLRCRTSHSYSILFLFKVFQSFIRLRFGSLGPGWGPLRLWWCPASWARALFDEGGLKNRCIWKIWTAQAFCIQLFIHSFFAIPKIIQASERRPLSHEMSKEYNLSFATAMDRARSRETFYLYTWIRSVGHFPDTHVEAEKSINEATNTQQIADTSEKFYSRLSRERERELVGSPRQENRTGSKVKMNIYI